MKTLKIRIASYERMNARTLRDHQRRAQARHGGADKVIHVGRELPNGVFPEISGASGVDRPGEAGLAHRGGEARGARQVGPDPWPVDDNAVRFGGTNKGRRDARFARVRYDRVSLEIPLRSPQNVH